mmetsp:Transcript_48792/g.147014  ORF Transcript_48792/g.147014 Transcript_48792/m.147014 type:complete len:215 (+) Transcript_48792:300-944(+)
MSRRRRRSSVPGERPRYRPSLMRRSSRRRTPSSWLPTCPPRSTSGRTSTQGSPPLWRDSRPPRHCSPPLHYCRRLEEIHLRRSRRPRTLPLCPSPQQPPRPRNRLSASPSRNSRPPSEWRRQPSRSRRSGSRSPCRRRGIPGRRRRPPPQPRPLRRRFLPVSRSHLRPYLLRRPATRRPEMHDAPPSRRRPAGTRAPPPGTTALQRRRRPPPEP